VKGAARPQRAETTTRRGARGERELLPRDEGITGRARWHEAGFTAGFGVAGAALSGGLFAALSAAVDRVQVVWVGAVLVSGLGVVLGSWVARLRTRAVTDPLTGLFNRRSLALRLGLELRRATGGAPRSAMPFIDLDRLKQLNDRFGHLTGDEAVVAVAGCILENVRASDVAARVGGDEFNGLLTRSSVAAAERVAQRIGGGAGRAFRRLSGATHAVHRRRAGARRRGERGRRRALPGEAGQRGPGRGHRRLGLSSMLAS
jgi:diguanylate cyclase (GGDEF)-like protein